MNQPILNLIFFFSFTIVAWVLYKIANSTTLFTNKKQQLKTNTEDILKQLYHVAQSNRTATISDLAGALMIKRKTILPIVEAMATSGLIKSSDEVIHLSPEGTAYALKIIRVHRLWEKYLAENTGYQASEWHHLAEKMEHQLDMEATKVIDTSLGNPMFDPHGDPIPTAKGEIADVNWIPLPAFPVNKPGKILHIEDEPNIIYQQILKSRIFIGSHIMVVNSTNSEVEMVCEGHKHKFSAIVAANINVAFLSIDEAYEEKAMRLSSLKQNEKAEVLGISMECRGASRRRLLDLGILPGTAIKIDLESPLKDPIAYTIRKTSIALRNSLADMILIQKNTTHGNN